MHNRSIMIRVCHGVLLLTLALMPLPSCLAGGNKTEKPQGPTFLETMLSNRKGSIDVEWKIEKFKSAISPSPNLYHITILAPRNRPNVTLLVNEKPVINIASQTRSLDFDFSNYPPGEIKVTLLVFDNVKAGSSSETIDVIAVPNIVSGRLPPGQLK